MLLPAGAAAAVAAAILTSLCRRSFTTMHKLCQMHGLQLRELSRTNGSEVVGVMQRGLERVADSNRTVGHLYIMAHLCTWWPFCHGTHQHTCPFLSMPLNCWRCCRSCSKRKLAPARACLCFLCYLAGRSTTSACARAGQRANLTSTMVLFLILTGTTFAGSDYAFLVCLA